jgi:plasmid stabilization system protein ParE
MARFRLSSLARSDIAKILALSAERWGDEGKHRYAALLTAAMRKVAAQPDDAAATVPGCPAEFVASIFDMHGSATERQK